MKSFILAAVVFSAFSSLAFAGEICGKLGSYSEGPHCTSGQACPMYVRLQYALTTENGDRLDLQTSDTAVFESFNTLLGQEVCVQGEVRKTIIDNVSEVSAR